MGIYLNPDNEKFQEASMMNPRQLVPYVGFTEAFEALRMYGYEFGIIEELEKY